MNLEKTISFLSKRMWRVFLESGRQGVDFFAPGRCLACGGLLVERGTVVALCPLCVSAFEPVQAPFCRCCGKELPASQEQSPLCGVCLRNPPPYLCCRSLFTYNGAMRDLVLQMKFQKSLTVLAGIRQLCATVEPSGLGGVDLIVPVPLHRKRLQERGYNQALLLCRILFQEKEGQIVPNLLERVKNTPPQSTLNRAKRCRNLASSFRVRNTDLVRDKRICLVDDVMTTGATVRECSKTLIKSGALSVVVLTLARVVMEMEWS